MKKNVLVVGTGTIGEPLIGLLADFRKKIDIANVFFNKRTPLIDEVAKVESLIVRGAKLVTSPIRKPKFEKMGHKVSCTYEEALEKADVVIDCTPAGNENKELYYLPAHRKAKKVFIAQGSEKGFGMPYAYGINDDILKKDNPDFIQVVSCNTHNISSLIKTLAPNSSDLIYGDFTCIRRANDISQNGSFIASPEVGKHSDSRFGTHHARDTADLFGTMRIYPNIFSSALKTNTQYMHIIRFTMQVKGSVSRDAVIDRFKENKFTSLTHKTLANKVFSFGRDHGYYGRIFNHTVVSIPAIYVGQLSGETLITGYCFTPQDGNSLLSSVAATMHAIHKNKMHNYMKLFDSYLYNEI